MPIENMTSIILKVYFKFLFLRIQKLKKSIYHDIKENLSIVSLANLGI